MKIITYETDVNAFNNSLLKYTCDKIDDIDLVVLGIGDEWKGVSQKITGASKYVRNLDESEVVMFADCRDVFIQNTGKCITKAYESTSDRVLFGTDPVCFPLIPLCDFFPTTKYLNSGVYIGSVKKLIEMYDVFELYYSDVDGVINRNFGITSAEIDAEEYVYESRLGDSLRQCDQLLAQLIFLTTELIDLDYTKNFVQTSIIVPSTNDLFKRVLKRHGKLEYVQEFYDLVLDRKKSRIFNERTNTYPKVIHAPGPKVQISTFRKFLRGDYDCVGTLF